MGFFSLKKKKKGAECETGDKKSRKPSISSFLQSRGRNKQGSEPLSPSSVSSSQNVAPTRPILTINTSPLTPPRTPDDSPHSPKSVSGQQSLYQRRTSEPRVHFNDDPRFSLITPPQSPKSSLKSSNTSPKREAATRSKSFVSFFESPRNRKLREIREGKRPSVSSDLDNDVSPGSDHDSEGLATSDAESLTEGICDPSGSTTYSSSFRRRRKLSGHIPAVVYTSDKEVFNRFKCPTLRVSSV